MRGKGFPIVKRRASAGAVHVRNFADVFILAAQN
jgi:hypothetical protein